MLRKIMVLTLSVASFSAFANEPDPLLFMTLPGFAEAYNAQQPSAGDRFTSTVKSGLNEASNRVSNTLEHAKAGMNTEAPRAYPQGPQMLPPSYPSYMNRPGPVWRQAPPMVNFAGQSYTPANDSFRSVGYGSHSMTAYSSATYTGLDPVAAPRSPNPGTPIIRSNPNPYVASTDNFWTNSAADKIWDKTKY